MIRAVPRRRSPVIRYSDVGLSSINAGQTHYFIPLNEISRNVPKYSQLVELETIGGGGGEGGGISEVIQPSCEVSLEKLGLINSQINQLITLFSNPDTTIETVISTLRS
jgi:hypothetical protein